MYVLMLKDFMNLIIRNFEKAIFNKIFLEFTIIEIQKKVTTPKMKTMIYGQSVWGICKAYFS